MRILIACDEKTSADRLYYDLKRSGLPQSVDVYVLSVADVFVVPGYEAKARRSKNEAYLKKIDQEIKKAQKIADAITKKFGLKFPGWRFHVEGVGGSPAVEILNKAEKWKVDLIVLGSHGRIGPGEFFVGSVALKVLSEAHCSVRIVRTDAKENYSPSRFIIGVDGSPQSDAVINSLLSRHWPVGSSAHLVTILNPVIYTAYISEEPYIYPPSSLLTYTPSGSGVKKEWRKKGDKTHRGWIKNMHEEYKLKLKYSGLIVSSFIEEGEPKKIILEEAKKWGAECIFVGALGHSRAERFFMGSVSSAIAARAHCSVEVIRDEKQVKPVCGRLKSSLRSST